MSSITTDRVLAFMNLVHGVIKANPGHPVSLEAVRKAIGISANVLAAISKSGYLTTVSRHGTKGAIYTWNAGEPTLEMAEKVIVLYSVATNPVRNGRVATLTRAALRQAEVSAQDEMDPTDEEMSEALGDGGPMDADHAEIMDMITEVDTKARSSLVLARRNNAILVKILELLTELHKDLRG